MVALLMDRSTTYEIRIFYVKDNCIRETLLPIAKKNVSSYFNEIHNNEDPAPEDQNNG